LPPRRWCRRDVLGCDLLPPGLLGRRRFGWRGECFGLDGRGWAAGLWGQDVVNLSPVRVEEGVAGVGKLLWKSVGGGGVWAVEVRKQSFEPAVGGVLNDRRVGLARGDAKELVICRRPLGFGDPQPLVGVNHGEPSARDGTRGRRPRTLF